MISHVGSRIFRVYLLFEHLGNSDFIELTTFEFLTLGVHSQFYYAFIIHYLSHMVNYSAGIILIYYICIMLLIYVPLNSFCLFIASYTKMKILRIWCCVPLFRGLGYTFLLCKIVNLIVSMYAVTQMLYVLMARNKVYISKGKVWNICNYTHMRKTCIPRDTQDFFHCEKGVEYELSNLRYIWESIFQTRTYAPPENATPVFGMAITNVCLWIGCCIVLFLGIRRFVNVFIVCSYMLCGGILLVFGTIVVTAPPEKSGFTRSILYNTDDTYKPGNLYYWAMSIVQCSGSIDVAGMVWLGTQMPKTLSPVVAAIGIMMFKTMFLFILLISLRYTLDTFAWKHSSILGKCIVKVTAYDIFLGVLLSTFCKFGKSEVSFATTYILTLSGTMYLEGLMSANVVIDSIMDVWPVLKTHRFIACLFFCTTNFLLSLLLFSEYSRLIVPFWIDYQTTILSMILYILIAILANYIYSYKLLASDYYFTYGVEQAAPLVVIWRAAPIISLYVASAILYWVLFSDSNNVQSQYQLLSVPVTLVIIGPVLLFFILEVAQAVNKISFYPDLPSANWGPYEPEIKNKRNQFVPERDLCYRHKSITCTHLCLVKVEAFKNEQVTQNKKFEEVFAEMKKAGEFSIHKKTRATLIF